MSLLTRNQRIAVFGPHPDDFDTIGVTLRQAVAAGATVELAVMTTGAGGVAPEDFPGLDFGARAALREAEQRNSCRYFGLGPEHQHYLRLDAGASGRLGESAEAFARVSSLLASWTPDLVFLPHPNDPNLAHQGTFSLVDAALHAAGSAALLLLNRDPKTIAMRYDLYVTFDAAEAEWKRALLRHHESQQRRNLRTRGVGLDERVLALNRELAVQAGHEGFAEAFELRRAGQDETPLEPARTVARAN